MDRFDYKVSEGTIYLSSGLTPGDVRKPVARGSRSSFSTPLHNVYGRGSIQFIAEPAVDSIDIVKYGVALATTSYTTKYQKSYRVEPDDHSITVRYLQNGVYTVRHQDITTRIVAQTGPVVIKMLSTETEVYIIVDGVSVQVYKETSALTGVTIAPNGGVMYDKVIHNHTDSIDELVDKSIFRVSSQNGRLEPTSRDRLFEPELVLADEMYSVDDYRVSSRKLTLANTAAAFYSDTSKIEKSVDGENWSAVQKVEYHGEDAMIFRSKDPSFALRYFDTNMDQFIIPGATTAVTGGVYKVGGTIGSYFSHDCYRIHGGGLTIESDEMTSVTIMGYLPDNLVEQFDPTIDFDGTNFGKIHLYTISASEVLELVANEIFISAIGINLDHLEVMNNLAGISEMSYADQLEHLQPGVSINGDNEYAILDLQWSV